MPSTNQLKGILKNEYAPIITQELSRKSRSNHAIITRGKSQY
nr:MAG TPA: hypothetical protein [Caudoviricetes sp.]